MISSQDLPHYLTGRWITDLANFSAFAFHALTDLNWAGFYLDNGERLVLGPFQGKPACMEIAYGKGVCGTAFRERKIMRVGNVHEFPGHIACDSASRSELVVPLVTGSQCIGVFDLDSPSLSRFGEKEERLVAGWVEELLARTDLANRPWNKTP